VHHGRRESVSIDLIVKIAGRIAEMTERLFPERTPKKEKAKTTQLLH